MRLALHTHTAHRKSTHQAEAKNTSAHFALSDILARSGRARPAGGRAPTALVADEDEKVMRRTLLLNLDVDNVMAESGIRFTFDAMGTAYVPGAVVWRSARGTGMSGLTGRICCWAADFVSVGGYDQEYGDRPFGGPGR